MPLQRYSSRLHKLDETFLSQRLHQARAYDRIAGYFRSSMLSLLSDALETVTGPIRVVCNSDLNLEDVQTAQAAKMAMRQEWSSSDPVTRYETSKPQLQKLYRFLCAGKMQVKVLPRPTFGLEHGKAGVITLADGAQTAFIGSANESLKGWRTNYELIWEDDSPETVAWVQAEFDYLWNNPHAVPLADFVIEDIGRLASRTIVPTVEVWRAEPRPAEAIIETPVFAREFGLWEHQKYFINLAFQAHQTSAGARFVLADQVGLGKTVQLALSALLMALVGDKPILVIVPKSLIGQWQTEMKELLAMPSAYWNGRQWVDENEIEYPATGPSGIKKCPRRVGIISQGLITKRSDVVEYLKELSFECVIVDEAHRARRANLAANREHEAPEPNNLMAFLLHISGHTRSLLLATATPVQMYPVEAWDLLLILAGRQENILGNQFSRWYHRRQALAVAMQQAALPTEATELWSWVRNPLPTSTESRDFKLIRQSLQLPDSQPVAAPEDWNRLKLPDQKRVKTLGPRFGAEHNPFIRFIIRRTRDYLETTLDPETLEPYLKAVKVELLGENDRDAIKFPPYLQDAYASAEEFCDMLAGRAQNTGNIRTILLRRVGSTIHAGQKTALKMLGGEEIPDETEDLEETAEASSSISLTEREALKLREFIDLLQANQEPDPKYAVITRLLLHDRWLDQGCIIFSQYFDSIWWLAITLSAELPAEPIAIYAGGSKSGVMLNGEFLKEDRNNIKRRVQTGELRLLLGTDAASEGLNLQRLGTLINLDLPWNPTRLEQRKGRIQRIGQLRDTVSIYNLRYQGSVEDRVHQLLSNRLESIHALFGQLPDVLKDVWIDVAEKRIEQAQQTINELPEKNPFEIKYHRIEKVPWETCNRVLDAADRKQHLARGW